MSHAVTQTLEVFSKHEATDNEQGMVANPVSPSRGRTAGRLNTAWSTQAVPASRGYTELIITNTVPGYKQIIPKYKFRSLGTI